MTKIHPAIIEQQRRQREERSQEDRRVPLYAPTPPPPRPCAPASSPAQNRGTVIIDFTL